MSHENKLLLILDVLIKPQKLKIVKSMMFLPEVLKYGWNMWGYLGISIATRNPRSAINSGRSPGPRRGSEASCSFSFDLTVTLRVTDLSHRRGGCLLGRRRQYRGGFGTRPYSKEYRM
jgi:hypothetical protein